MDLVPCGTDNYNYTNKEEIVLKGVDTSYCLKDKSYLKMRSIISAKNFNMLDIRLNACVNSTANNNSCASEADQRAYFKGVNFAIFPVFKYFDFDEYVDPIKSYIDDVQFYPV